jgi:hypothetical protein
MWRCVDLALSDVSEELITSIFTVEKYASGEPAPDNQLQQVTASTTSGVRSVGIVLLAD